MDYFAWTVINKIGKNEGKICIIPKKWPMELKKIDFLKK